MYRRILVPVDGSDTSKRGLLEASRLARELGSIVRLIHVVDDASLALAVSGLATNVGEMLSSLAAGGEAVLAEARQLASSHDVAVDTVMLHCLAGRISDKIVKDAIDWHADLIVIGTHGRRGAGRLLLGSDAEQVVRQSSVPVLLVRDAAPDGHA